MRETAFGVPVAAATRLTDFSMELFRRYPPCYASGLFDWGEDSGIFLQMYFGFTLNVSLLHPPREMYIHPIKPSEVCCGAVADSAT